MLNSLCFLTQTSVSERDIQRFGFEILRKRGLKVSIIDVRRWIAPDAFNEFYDHNSKVSLGETKLFEIAKSADISTIIDNLENTLVIDLIKRIEVLHLYLELEKRNIPVARFSANAIPQTETSIIERILQKLSQLHNPLDVLDLLKKLSNKLIHKDIPKANYLLAGGKKSVPNIQSKTTKIIWAHTLDYDCYLNWRNKSDRTTLKQPYAVFLDEYGPFHPDYFLTGNPIGNDYYAEMCRIFKVVEDKLQIPILILAHPRSRYETMTENWYQGRDIVKGSTIDYVAGANLVLGHASTAFNFACILEKPTCFLLPDSAKGLYYRKMISTMAQAFGKTALTFDILNGLGKDTILSVDEVSYKRYREDYIKTVGSQEKLFWDIVVDEILEDN